MREGWSPSMLSNIAWAFLYIAAFAPFISAAFEGSRTITKPEESTREKVEVLS